MPVQHALWKVGQRPEALEVSRLPNEQVLEEMIVKDPRILSSEWMLIGRQERTDDGGRIDLLAITPDGSLILIELKRDRTPREVVAQALDYAEWVSRLSADRLMRIYSRFSGGGRLDTAFQERFGTPLDEEALNKSHQIILVAAELDSSTERIVTYLNARDIAINVLFFQVFKHGADQLLSRAWLIPPEETQVNASQQSGPDASGAKEPWNGEFYVSFGGYEPSLWDDAMRLGFICAGGGLWYSQTLKLLQPGDRVWVKIPKTGYVGVGRVLEAVQSVDKFILPTPDGDRSILELVTNSEPLRRNAGNPELGEYFVRVQWLQTKDASHAFDELGLFGNQNSVCKPTAAKWRHTVERLKTAFPLWNQSTTESP